MKKFYIFLTLALALFASVFICKTAFAEIDPWDVCVEVEHNGDVFRYKLSDKLYGITDQAQQRGFYLGARSKRTFCSSLIDGGLPERAVYNYLLPDFDSNLKHFSYVCCKRSDAEVKFGKNGFSYRAGHDGVEINEKKLFDEMLDSNGRLLKITLPLNVDKAVTVEQLKSNTVLRGTFSTTFRSSGANRIHNIMLAASSLNGTTVGVNEIFSFNGIVGNRTEANGYKTSKVILDGNYTEGVGGGVCQVSTTLYNALLLAGFVPNAVQHSLVSSYVMAGFDAMVSYGAADLTFINDTGHPIYIAAAAHNKTITFNVYGEPNPYKIVRENVEVRDRFATSYVVDAQKYPELVYVDQIKVLVGGSDGVKSKSYLKYYLDGKLVETKLIRSNKYKRVDAVIARGYLQRSEELPEG